MTEGSAHLTTSRVNRLLRPLGNKCNALAALPKSATASHVTYSRQSSCWDPDSRPPLTVLCRSAGAKKLTLDGHSVDEFELSRRIYAVYDAFKNVVHVAYGHPCYDRVPSLATMCALIIGENMPVENSGSTLTNSEEEIHENNILSGDGIYEAVPPHCRRFLVVSHALSIILCTCVHHHTLITILLDHCLSAGLVHESTRLLNIILAQAFLTSNLTFVAPVTHPAHTNYLVDLHSKWTAGNKALESSLLFTTSAFCQMVLDTLSQSASSNSHLLWNSKVLDKFLHAVEGCHTDSYIVIVRALSWSFRDALGSPSDLVQGVQLAALRDKLCESMSNLFDLLFVQPAPHSSSLPLSIVQATIDMIYDCHSAQLHRSRMPTSGSLINLPDIMIVFATHILVTFRTLIDNSDLLLTILDDLTPVPTTFTKLVVYFSRPQDSQALGDFVEAFLSELDRYSFALRAEKLFALDASLWACGLHHFETSIATSQKGDSTLITRYKQRLMEAVDTAERRCFGGDASSSSVISPVRSTRAKCAQRGRPSGHWEWEDMVDSWIRKTPMRKKRKIDDRVHTPPRHGPLCVECGTTSEGVFEPSLFSTPLSIQYRFSSTFSLSSPSRVSEREHRTEDESEYQQESDKENCAGSSAPTTKASKRVRRRSSNFFSLLADAQTKRIVLHSNRRSEPKPPHSIILEKYALPSSQEPWRASHQYKQPKANYRKTSPLPAPPASLLPSDDLLDLFAYATSSPARC